jgi:hypothetical protein
LGEGDAIDDAEAEERRKVEWTGAEGGRRLSRVGATATPMLFLVRQLNLFLKLNFKKTYTNF